MAKSIKFRVGIAIILVFTLLTGCGGAAGHTINDVSKTVSDHVNNVVDSNNPYVMSVKLGYPMDHPSQLYGETFENFFGSPTWTYFKAGSSEDVVEFTGYMMYQETEVKARIQFIIQDDDTFDVGALSFNDVPQNDLTKSVLINTIFNSSEAVTPQNEDMAVQGEEEVNVEVEPTNSFPASLYAGEIEGLPVALGNSIEFLLDKMGEYEMSDNWDGGVYYSYPEAVFFTYDEVVTAIALRQGSSFLDITIGQTLEEIEDVLGESTGIAFNEIDENWFMGYQVGNHMMYFEANERTGSTTSVTLYANKKITS